MDRLLSIIVFFIYCHFAVAQTDYNQLVNWYYHPDKPVNFINSYNLDIAVIDRNLKIDSTILITNNSETNTGIDVFWVHPTQLTDPPNSPSNVDLSQQPYSLIASTILAQGGLLAKYGRFYAPRYRQASPASFLDPAYSDSTRAAAIITAYKDVKASFEHYLANYNNGNKIILAGHSQGSFLLGMLIRDMLDNNPEQRAKLLTAILGGSAYFHAQFGQYSGGQWVNVPLCTAMNQCECIHTWRSFKETQNIPNLVTTLPVFNTTLVDSGLVYRNVDLSSDWFVQDSLFYSSLSTPLRYYITPDAGYNLGGAANFIAFDSLYTARFKRTSRTKAVLAVNYITDTEDRRPNDLLDLENSAGFPFSGFHNKDYHIYLWALMQQIDAKVKGCGMTTNIDIPYGVESDLKVYPNPNNGAFNIEINEPILKDDYLVIMNAFGQIVKKELAKPVNQVYIEDSGIYFLVSKHGMKKIIVQ